MLLVRKDIDKIKINYYTVTIDGKIVLNYIIADEEKMHVIISYGSRKHSVAHGKVKIHFDEDGYDKTIARMSGVCLDCD